MPGYLVILNRSMHAHCNTEGTFGIWVTCIRILYAARTITDRSSGICMLPSKPRTPSIRETCNQPRSFKFHLNSCKTNTPKAWQKGHIPLQHLPPMTSRLVMCSLMPRMSLSWPYHLKFASNSPGPHCEVVHNSYDYVVGWGSGVRSATCLPGI